MSEFREEGSRLVYTNSGETVWLEAHGADTFRVRRSMSSQMPVDTDALLAPVQTDATIEMGDAAATATNGSLVARISKQGSISFFRVTADGELPLCSEAAQSYRQLRGESYAIEADFEAYTDEKVYLPAGVAWRNAWTDEELTGGQWITVDAPLDQIPLFLRVDCKSEFLSVVFEKR